MHAQIIGPRSQVLFFGGGWPLPTWPICDESIFLPTAEDWRDVLNFGFFLPGVTGFWLVSLWQPSVHRNATGWSFDVGGWSFDVGSVYGSEAFREILILFFWEMFSQMYQKSYYKDNWLVEAKRSHRLCYVRKVTTGVTGKNHAFSLGGGGNHHKTVFTCCRRPYNNVQHCPVITS